MSHCQSPGAGREMRASRPSVTRSLAMSLLLAAVLTAASATAYVVAMSVQELTNRAELIVKGVVATKAATQSAIEVTVRAEEVIKGVPGKGPIRIRYPSGLEDTPQFTVGESVMLFLIRLDAESWQVVGGMQGKVNLDPQTR